VDIAKYLAVSNLSFEEAAAVPMAAVTALQGLRHRGEIRPEQMVLISGASSGVGTFAVKTTKSYGPEVTGVTSAGELRRRSDAPFVVPTGLERVSPP
jgi:NADPH:quinone reductase-like Zn-dependent oxidoreductase